MSTLRLGPNDVPFTQFLRPDGRPREVCIERAPDIAAKAKALIARGYRFEIEELMDRTVSMTVEAPRGQDDDGPVSIHLCPNGPAVPDTTDALITEAYDRVMRGAVQA
jgi:hypothetical protein